MVPEVVILQTSQVGTTIGQRPRPYWLLLDRGVGRHRVASAAPARRHIAVPIVPRVRRLVAEVIGVAGAACVFTAMVLRVWEAPLRLPWDTRSDATLISTMVKNTLETGWLTDQPRLVLFGQHLDHFPHGGETFQLAAMKAVTSVATGAWP